MLEELEELKEFRGREATPEEIERGRVLDNALENARKTLREALERTSAHYKLAASVDATLLAAADRVSGAIAYAMDGGMSAKVAKKSDGRRALAAAQ